METNPDQEHNNVNLAAQVDELTSLPSIENSDDATFNIFKNHDRNIKKKMGIASSREVSSSSVISRSDNQM